MSIHAIMSSEREVWCAHSRKLVTAATSSNKDPVVCCIYFNRLTSIMMNMLLAKRDYNPLGACKVKDYFLRIEFQHRGSPHAHILLWMEGDPHEPV